MNIFSDIEERNQAVGSAAGYSDLKKSTKPSNPPRGIGKKFNRKPRAPLPLRHSEFPYLHTPREFKYVEPEIPGEVWKELYQKPSDEQLQAVETTLLSLCKVSKRKLFLGETVVFDYCLYLRISNLMVTFAKWEAAISTEPWGLQLAMWTEHTERILDLILQFPQCFDRDVFYLAINSLDLDLRLKVKNFIDSGATVGLKEIERLLGLDRLVHAGAVGWGNALESHGGNQTYQNLHAQMWMELEAVRKPGGVVMNKTNTSSSLPAVEPDVGTLVGEVGKDESL